MEMTLVLMLSRLSDAQKQRNIGELCGSISLELAFDLGVVVSHCFVAKMQNFGLSLWVVSPTVFF